MKLILRGGESVLVSDWREALALMAYYDFSQRIGSYSRQDLHELNYLISEVDTKLKADIYSLGAHFGYCSALLFALVRKLKPMIVVETGVAQGVTTYTILRALQLNGDRSTLISIDKPNADGRYVRSEKEAGWLVPNHLRRNWDLRLGSSSEILPTIQLQVDLFYHDSLHTYQNMLFEYEWAYVHTRPGGVIASDDTGANHAYNDFLSKHSDLAQISNYGNFGALLKRRPST